MHEPIPLKLCKCGAHFQPGPKATGRNRYRCRACNAAAAAIYRTRNASKVRQAEERRSKDPIRYAQVRRSSRKHNLKKFYGLTPEQYERLLEKQHRLCAICRRPETSATSVASSITGERKVRRLAVDHDHKTTKVRGLLCFHCNSAIGHLQDDARLARLLAEYLEEASKDGDAT